MKEFQYRLDAAIGNKQSIETEMDALRAIIERQDRMLELLTDLKRNTHKYSGGAGPL